MQKRIEQVMRCQLIIEAMPNHAMIWDLDLVGERSEPS